MVRKASKFISRNFTECRKNILLLSKALRAAMAPEVNENVDEMFQQWLKKFGELAGQVLINFYNIFYYNNFIIARLS